MGKLFEKMRKLDGAANIGSGLMEDCLQTPSPSVNWAFATPGNGLPYGTGMLLYGPPKGGKSIICNAFIGGLHAADPEAKAITFNTELRAEMQTTDKQLAKFGIDQERFLAFDVNQPEFIFDRIENDINAACQEGEKIKLIVIDSLTAIQGRRSMNSTSVMDQQIGDHALTISVGLKRIMPIIRKHKIALIMTDHVRAEMDMRQQMRGKTIKMASGWATKHCAEFFCFVEPNLSKDGKINLAGEEFTDPNLIDFMEKAQKIGRKIRFRVEESSVGVEGRTAEFTLDYNKGIINQYEEVFTLAKNMGIIEKPNNVTYSYGDKNWRGLVACLTAIKDDGLLRKELLDKAIAKDRASLGF
jgi:RecA/RadA recombinase